MRKAAAVGPTEGDATVRPSEEVLYHYFDLLVSCDFPLNELPTGEDVPPHLAIRLALQALEVPANLQWDWHWRLSTEEIFLSMARMEWGYLLQFPDRMTVRFSAEKRTVEVSPGADVSAPIWRHLLLDHVLPRLVGHEGRLVLHAAAVACSNGAVVFLGQTGRGKSTLAAGFHAAGYELLTDDCLLLDPVAGGFRVIPAYPGLRLWPDSAATFSTDEEPEGGGRHGLRKKRIDLQPTSSHAISVRALFLLEPPTESAEVEVLRVDGAEALAELMPHGFLLDPSDRETIERYFASTGELVGSLPLFRVRYPRDFSQLAGVREAIEQSLRRL